MIKTLIGIIVILFIMVSFSMYVIMCLSKENKKEKITNEKLNSKVDKIEKNQKINAEIRKETNEEKSEIRTGDDINNFNASIDLLHNYSNKK